MSDYHHGRDAALTDLRAGLPHERFAGRSEAYQRGYDDAWDRWGNYPPRSS